MTLGEELDALLENASEAQLEQFENILQEVREWDIPSTNKGDNDRFWALVRFRKELRESFS